ncbi:hypothetical protein D9758_005881 [Tetrapyrgos nigripes]|uniref:Non-ribosomal peptide synthetase n=1 Tax=Tetrapyrgos nigripes TaxID=182062 RepID=A0A8H5G2W0_9AGAR|nr:hypothetical protein D9758_005881 [Tetrapyrgos nigripes]
MSTETKVNTYDDAEKGTQEITPPPLTYLPTVYPEISEKKPIDTLMSLEDKKEVAAPPVKKSPPKPKKKVSKWIRWVLWFNTYRKFFTLTFTLNMVALALAASGHFPYAVKYNGAFVVGNFNFAILMRNEIFGRILYWFVNTFFAKWTPLWWRLGCTSVLQHLGGIHSGCALSGVIWLLFKVVRMFLTLEVEHDAVLILGVCTNVAVIISALSAIPWVRNTHHKYECHFFATRVKFSHKSIFSVFERHHRFVGWTGLFCTWAFVILGDIYDPTTKTWNLDGVHVIRQQDFWFTIGMTVFIALPWICVREVPVDIELPSPKVAIIRFERGMQQGLLGRISRSSIMEYHAFGIISEGKHAKYHYMIAGVQGDFTRRLVNDPPKTLWTRQVKFAGVSNTSTLYHRGIRICTGTGIGAALSTCLQSPNWFLIWIGSDQEKTFGPTISGLIHRHVGPERLILWDIVFITSNYIGNTEIMQGCKEAGIPVFGTLWDF